MTTQAMTSHRNYNHSMKKPTTTPENWLAENQEALDSSNDFVNTHGLPLARYRTNTQPIEVEHQEEQPADPKNTGV